MKLITVMKSKLHRAAVTSCEIDYEGSLRVDPELIKRAEMLPFEWVHIWNITNGQRFETYLIEGAPGSREFCVNGAAARLCQPGDRIIVATTCTIPIEDGPDHEPVVVLLDERNRVVDPVNAG
ncbi:MAG: aspartate 1-decarboxylase [Planctomycetota bacterium]